MTCGRSVDTAPTEWSSKWSKNSGPTISSEGLSFRWSRRMPLQGCQKSTSREASRPWVLCCRGSYLNTYGLRRVQCLRNGSCGRHELQRIRLFVRRLGYRPKGVVPVRSVREAYGLAAWSLVRKRLAKHSWQLCFAVLSFARPHLKATLQCGMTLKKPRLRITD